MSYSIKSPEPFNFNNPSEWSNWIRRFERYRLASKLVEESQKNQVNTLMYLLGDKADDIFTSFGLTEEQAAEYDIVKNRFNEYFALRKNVIFERALFNKRVQSPNEPVDEFIVSLYRLVEHCNYGTLKEGMIRDRLVVGLTDNTLSERLQMRPDLTLTQAVQMVRNSELVKKQQAVIREPEQCREVDFVKRKQKDQHHKKGSKLCSWYGSNTSHERSRCPANNNRCHKCGKLGHFKKVCRSLCFKSIETNSAVSHEATEENCFLGTVTQPNFSDKPTIDVYVNGVKLN